MRFLVVDDDPVCCDLLQQTLAPYGTSKIVHDGYHAVKEFGAALIDGPPYDLVCLDIMMPRSNGHETLEAIRNLESQHQIFGSASVKVIMTTALDDSKNCIRSFCEGCDSYLTKPIDPQKLLQLIRKLMGKLSSAAT